MPVGEGERSGLSVFTSGFAGPGASAHVRPRRLPFRKHPPRGGADGIAFPVHATTVEKHAP